MIATRMSVQRARRACGWLALSIGCAASAAVLVAQTTPPTPPPSPPPTTQPANPPPAAPAPQPQADPPPAQPPQGAPQRARQADHIAGVVAGVIAKDHGLVMWRLQRGLQTDLVIKHGEETALEGTLTFETKSNRARFESKNGVIAVFDGQKAWVSPAAAELPMARFHLLTWPYFIAAPFKLSDPGTRQTEFAQRFLKGARLDSFKLTFTEGVGDTPKNDWYRVYSDPKTHLLYALGYIVAYGRSVEEAEKEPHAIVFSDYQAMDGAHIATSWTFYNWTDDLGLRGEPIGGGKLTNLRFVKPPEGFFTKPADAKEDKLPERPDE